MGEEFVGSGWAFPMRVDPTGKIALVEGTEEIEESIRVILGTAPGERPMRPEFGCRAKELLFAPRNAVTEGMLREYVEDAMARWEPRIDVTSVTVTNDPSNDGAWLVGIHYTIKATHDERSIVYPFYIADEEVI